MADVKAHTDILRTKVRALEEERHTAQAELRARLLKVDKLTNKYDVLMTKFALRDGDGEVHSQAHYIVKAAQEREELYRRGDELAALTAQAEKELRALENTMTALGQSNKDYQKTLQRLDPASSDNQKRIRAEDQLRNATDVLREKVSA